MVQLHDATRQGLDRLIGQAASEMTQRRGEPPASAVPDGETDRPGEAASGLDGLLFFGNPHETVPRALLLDPRLGHVDKLGWQMMRMLVNPDRTTAVPTYDELQPLLRGAPGQKASRATVARVIAVLRLTRWVSLGHRARNAQNGRIIGNVYILHDEPLSPAEASVLDADYVEYVCRCLNHQNKVVKAVAAIVFEELQEAGALHELPTRLDTLASRSSKVRPPSPAKRQATQFSTTTQQKNQGEAPSSQREPGRVSHKNSPGFHREPSLESRAYEAVDAVLHENSGSSPRTVRTSHCVKPTGTSAVNLHWPACLSLDDSERQATQLLMSGLSGDTQQAILDEAAGRVSSGSVRNPKGFLRGLIKRAIGGEFVATGYAKTQAERRMGSVSQSTPPAMQRSAPRAATQPLRQPAAPTASSTPSSTTSPEEAQAAREQCLRKLGLWPAGGKNSLNSH
ncbi:STY4528 family pathogenicity island replication protein [Halomonas sp. C05BenzN]|uniref:STY4528 family pathogenicity island replication protein n=1 Tax=Halomonas sp. C05BenzN TaxID=3411041 RepID=UPI003B9657AE